VIGRRDPGSLLVVHDHFLQLELPAVLLAERHACLPRKRVGIEVREHPVVGEVEVPGEGGGHGGFFSVNGGRVSGGGNSTRVKRVISGLPMNYI
jgi:hypothetical protein